MQPPFQTDTLQEWQMLLHKIWGTQGAQIRLYKKLWLQKCWSHACYEYSLSSNILMRSALRCLMLLPMSQCHRSSLRSPSGWVESLTPRVIPNIDSLWPSTGWPWDPLSRMHVHGHWPQRKLYFRISLPQIQKISILVVKVPNSCHAGNGRTSQALNDGIQLTGMNCPLGEDARVPLSEVVDVAGLGVIIKLPGETGAGRRAESFDDGGHLSRWDNLVANPHDESPTQVQIIKKINNSQVFFPVSQQTKQDLPI